MKAMEGLHGFLGSGADAAQLAKIRASTTTGSIRGCCCDCGMRLRDAQNQSKFTHETVRITRDVGLDRKFARREEPQATGSACR